MDNIKIANSFLAQFAHSAEMQREDRRKLLLKYIKLIFSQIYLNIRRWQRRQIANYHGRLFILKTPCCQLWQQRVWRPNPLLNVIYKIIWFWSCTHTSVIQHHTNREVNTAWEFWKEGERSIFVLHSSYNLAIRLKSPRKLLQTLFMIRTLS
jgi:hypothetical protein